MSKLAVRDLQLVPVPHLVLGTVIAILLLILLSLNPTQKNISSSQVTINIPLTLQAKAIEFFESEADAKVWQTITVNSGDTLSSLGNTLGVDRKDIIEIAGVKKSLFRRLHPGDSLAITKDDAGNPLELKIIKSPLLEALITWSPDGLDYQQISREPDIYTHFYQGRINTSLSTSAQEAGMSAKTTMGLAAIFGWDIDFALDIRKGDSFYVIAESHHLDGNPVSDGPIIAAQFVNKGKVHTAIRYKVNDKYEYYSPKGQNMRKTFLRSPLDFTRITSHFNPNRLHPIFKTKRPHKGVDYGARTGTPIKATGHGKVIFSGKKGGYGNVVMIKHDKKHTTLYAHMSRFARGTRKGKRVKQGDTIGYVGSTGFATGPHLHYELRVNGVHRNPLNMKFPTGTPIPKEAKEKFLAYSQDILSKVNNYKESVQLAYEK